MLSYQPLFIGLRPTCGNWGGGQGHPQPSPQQPLQSRVGIAHHLYVRYFMTGGARPTSFCTGVPPVPFALPPQFLPLTQTAFIGVPCTPLGSGGHGPPYDFCTGWKACATKNLWGLGGGCGGGQGPVAQASRLWKPLALPPQFLPLYPSSHSSRAFWKWRRFSAWSQAADWGPSRTSPVISSSRWAGRQWSTMASGRARRKSSALTWYC